MLAFLLQHADLPRLSGENSRRNAGGCTSHETPGKSIGKRRTVRLYGWAVVQGIQGRMLMLIATLHALGVTAAFVVFSGRSFS
jgi:hypothetical protein